MEKNGSLRATSNTAYDAQGGDAMETCIPNSHNEEACSSATHFLRFWQTNRDGKIIT